MSTQARTVDLDAPILLDAALSTSEGIEFTAGEAVVTAQTAGVYQIFYSIRTSTGVGASINLLVDGTAVSDSTVAILADVGETTGRATVSLNEDSTVSIGTSGAAITLSSGTNAFLTLLRIA